MCLSKNDDYLQDSLGLDIKAKAEEESACDVVLELPLDQTFAHK